MTPNGVKVEISRFVEDLLKANLAIATNGVIIAREKQSRLVTWSSASEARLTDAVFGTIREYKSMLANGHYTAVLMDGSLIQLSYGFFHSRLIKHRLGYYPCPIMLEADALSGENLMDHLEVWDPSTYEESIRLWSPVRFDYDQAQASHDHPASHLHLLTEECRIPVHSPLSVGHFVRFIFEHFYPGVWAEHGFIREWPCTQHHRCLDETHRGKLHLDCRG
jgi:hypothetical protein